MSERVTIQRDTFDEVVLVMSQRQQVMFSDDELIPDDDVVSALQRLRSDVNESDNLNDEIDRLREERRWVSIEERLPDKEIPSERRTDDATLIAAVRILSRTIQTDDGVIPACLSEAASRLAELVEERRWSPVGERVPEEGVAYEVAAVRRGDSGYTEDKACITFAEHKRPSCAGPGGWIETAASPRYCNGLKVTHFRKRGPGPEVPNG